MSLLVEPISVKTAPFFKYGRCDLRKIFCVFLHGRAQKNDIAVRKRLSVERMAVLHLFLTVAVIYNAFVPRLPQGIFGRVIGGNPRFGIVEADGFRDRAADQAESYEAEMKPVEICHAVSPVPWAEARNNGFILPPDTPVRTAFLGIPAGVSLRSGGACKHGLY